MQAFYEMYLRHGLDPGALSNSNLMITGLSMMRGDLVSRSMPILPESRLGVYTAWGITPDEQVAIEEHFASLELCMSHVDTDYLPTLFNGLCLSW
jgi:hypothetical protein